jgi:hypothetical protein
MWKAYHCEVGKETTAPCMIVEWSCLAYHCEVGKETTAILLLNRSGIAGGSNS